MKLKRIFEFHALCAFPYAIGLLLHPRWVLSWLTSQPLDDIAATIARILGGALLAFSAMAWRARRLDDGPGLRAIVTFFFIYTTCGAIIELPAQLSGLWSLFNWSNFILYTFFAVNYGLFLRRGPASS
jgi:hypothetical protein